MAQGESKCPLEEGSISISKKFGYDSTVFLASQYICY